MQISVLHTSGFNPVVGERATTLFEQLRPKLGDKGLETLKAESIHVLSNCCDPKADQKQSVTNLVFGYVQSGKTMSFTSVSALANDNGFRVIIYFAGTKNNLLTQTTDRLRKDLIEEGHAASYYKMFENPTTQDKKHITNALRMRTCPTILITVLKHYKHIDNVTAIFKDLDVKSYLKNQGVLIIDDEADQASLNGYAYRNSKAQLSEEWEKDEFTSTYQSIIDLKDALPNHSYLQYTATPQGPLLISMLDMLSPKHHTVLTPGDAYTGGKVFFREEPGLIIEIPEAEVFHSKKNPLTQCPQSLIDALAVYFMGVVIQVYLHKKVDFLSMMIHADSRIDASEKFYKWTEDIITEWVDALSLDQEDYAYREVLKVFENNYPEAIRQFEKHHEPYPTFEEIEGYLMDALLDNDIRLIIGTVVQKDINWKDHASHILVGAEMLNRGFTVENLSVTYMPRYNIGKSTADTIQQRCRFFGYKRKYLWSCRVYLPESSIQDYSEYVTHEEEMRTWLKGMDSIEDVQRAVLLSPDLNATRKNILPANIVGSRMKGMHSLFAMGLNVIDANTKEVERFVKEHDFKLYKDYGTGARNHKYVRLPISDVISFLSEFKFNAIPDITRKQATIRYLNYLKESGQLKDSYIMLMGCDEKGYRERAFIPDTDHPQSPSVNNLFAGRDTKDGTKYPGDKNCVFEDAITIQIHRIKCSGTNDLNPWHNRIFYTLAINYPEGFATQYITVNKEDDDVTTED